MASTPAGDFDYDVHGHGYVPELIAHETHRFPPVDAICSALGGTQRCQDRRAGRELPTFRENVSGFVGTFRSCGAGALADRPRRWMAATLA